MCKAEYMSMKVHPQANIWSKRPMYRESGVFFAISVWFKISFLEISECRHIRDRDTIIMYKLQYWWHVWTLLVQSRESYFIRWARVIEWSPRENLNREVNYWELAPKPCVHSSVMKDKHTQLHSCIESHHWPLVGWLHCWEHSHLFYIHQCLTKGPGQNLAMEHSDKMAIHNLSFSKYNWNNR